MSTQTSQSNAPLVSVSPTTMYSGPPPPYSYASSTPCPPPVLNALISPAESRRPSGDEKDDLQRPTRESLPSIHEALKQGGAFSTYGLPESTHISITQPPTHPQQQPQPPGSTVAVLSAGTGVRSHPSEDARQEHPINGTSPPTSIPYPTQTQHPQQPHQSNHTSYSSADARRISLPAIFPFDHRLPPALPTLRTGQASLPPTHPEAQTPQRPSFSPRADRTPTSASSMNSNFTYPPYPPQYLYPAQPPTSSQPLYQPLTPHHPRPAGPSSFAEIEASRVPHDPRQPYRGYPGVPGDDHGVSVKRHLDYFDVEASLRDMCESSNRLVDFSNQYRHRVRDIQRTGCLPGMLPTLVECDEMIRHQHRIQEVLGRLREMLVTQQDVALNRHPQERIFKPHPNFEMEEPGLALDEGKPNGALNSEARKRRGRAAPPGRCHSCNRAETPEWRRGPDGARTLCNACGLHFAKLTRKFGPKASLGGSSLRPKPMGSGPGPGPPPS